MEISIPSPSSLMNAIICPSCGNSTNTLGSSHCSVCRSAFTQNSSNTSAQGELRDLNGRSYRLIPTTVTKIGSRGCAIMLSGIPTLAAQVLPVNGGFVVEDLSGSTFVNGVQIKSPMPLQLGDILHIGTVQLHYYGPATTHQTPIVVVPSQQQTALPLQPMIPQATLVPHNITLKSWGLSLPVVEGIIQLVSGPHRITKGSMVKKAITAAVLYAFTHSFLSMMPFWGKQEEDVWHLRIEDHRTGKLYEVLMRGESTSLPQMNDFVAIWGKIDGGNVLMERGYNYITDSDIWLR